MKRLSGAGCCLERNTVLFMQNQCSGQPHSVAPMQLLFLLRIKNTKLQRLKRRTLRKRHRFHFKNFSGAASLLRCMPMHGRVQKMFCGCGMRRYSICGRARMQTRCFLHQQKWRIKRNRFSGAQYILTRTDTAKVLPCFLNILRQQLLTR